jgi:hypothetical protein
MVSLPKSTVEADPQTKIQSQILRDMVVILEIGFEDFEIDVVLGLGTRLRKAGNVPHQQISESIAGRDWVRGIER